MNGKCFFFPMSAAATKYFPQDLIAVQADLSYNFPRSADLGYNQQSENSIHLAGSHL